MKSYSKPIIAGLVALISLGSIGVSFGHNLGINIDRMDKRLNLTDIQRVQIETIIEDSRPGLVDVRRAMKENRENWRVLNQQVEFDEALVHEVADMQGELKAEQMVLRAQRRSDIRNVLSEEQRVKMDKLRAQRHCRH